MQDLKKAEKNTPKTLSMQDLEQRSRKERRRKPSWGFTCITVVGWICRREWTRRKEDTGCAITGKQKR